MIRLFGHKTAEFSQIGVTTDWHCHLLPAVDDGMDELRHSVQALEDMRQAGIRTVVHTPHFNQELFPGNTEENIRAAFEGYVAALPSSITDNMSLRLAGEYMVTPGFEERDMKELLQIEPDKVLIEMSYYFPSANIEQAIFKIGMAGLTPVLAHPERYLYYAGNLKQFDRLHELGVVFQMNLLSLSGCYGRDSVRILEYLLKKGWYEYLGSDTHTTRHFRHISGLQFKEGYLGSLQALAR